MLVLGLKISLVVVEPVFNVCHVGQFLQARANLCFVKKHFFPIGYSVKKYLAALLIFIRLNSVSNTIMGSVIASKMRSNPPHFLYFLPRTPGPFLTLVWVCGGASKSGDSDFE